MPPAAAPAGAAGGAREKNGMFPIILQVAFMAAAYYWFRGRGVTPSEPSQASVPIAPPSMTRSPSPSSAPGFMESLLASASGKRLNVPQELAEYEETRVAALTGLDPKARLANAWAVGTPFTLFVFLSESALPLPPFDPSKQVGPVLKPWISEDPSYGGITASSVETPVQSSGSGGISGVLGLFGESTIKRYLAGPVPRHAPSGHFEGLSDAEEAGAAALIWKQEGLTYGFDESNYWETVVNVTLSPRVIVNASRLYAHVLLVVEGAQLDPSEPGFRASDVIRIVHPLIKLLPHKPRKTTYNLIDAMSPVGPGSDGPSALPGTNAHMAFGIGAATPTPTPSSPPEPEDDAAHGKGVQMRPYWKPTLSVQIVPDWSVYPGKGSLPPHVAAVLVVEPPPPGAPPGEPALYTPVSLVNDFWQLGHHLIAINDTVSVVPLTLSFSPQSLMAWSLMTTMERQWEMQAVMSGGESDSGATDLIKTVLLETNPILLAITMAVSMLHMIFDFLAFKNDISFWRSAKTMEGLSVRAIGVNFFFQLVIVLYLFENETSWMVLASSVVGVCIEAWKLRKAVAVNLTWSPSGWPSLSLEDREATYSTSGTKAHDEVATSHMIFVLGPLVVGYAIYSLLYEKHRSWYAWVLTSTTGFIYTFGFIQMVPQLYINYKLKSVAHMPWRAMVYKSLNTFIDDLFAFVVRMPWMHRIACLRDDVIFIIFIIQRFYYPVDKSRRNEFGSSAEDLEHMEAIKRGLAREPTRGKRERRLGPIPAHATRR